MHNSSVTYKLILPYSRKSDAELVESFAKGSIKGVRTPKGIPTSTDTLRIYRKVARKSTDLKFIGQTKANAISFLLERLHKRKATTRLYQSIPTRKLIPEGFNQRKLEASVR